jgi:hypothetical protein
MYITKILLLGKQLESLNEAIENCEDKNFKFENGHIVEDKQIDNELER